MWCEMGMMGYLVSSGNDGLGEELFYNLYYT